MCSHVSPDESLRPYVSRGRRSVSVCSNLRGMQYATKTTSQELLRLYSLRHISAETSTRCFGELFQDETVWLTQEQMAQLFGKGRTTITEHIGNIFKEGELDEEKVCRKFRHTTQHGAIEGLLQTQEVKYYNLDVIISVGYRVNASLPMMGLTSTSTLEKVRKQNPNTRNIRKSRRNRSIWKVLRNWTKTSNN